jgi:hypothetical protein
VYPLSSLIFLCQHTSVKTKIIRKIYKPGVPGSKCKVQLVLGLCEAPVRNSVCPNARLHFRLRNVPDEGDVVDSLLLPSGWRDQIGKAYRPTCEIVGAAPDIVVKTLTWYGTNSQ